MHNKPSVFLALFALALVACQKRSPSHNGSDSSTTSSVEPSPSFLASNDDGGLPFGFPRDPTEPCHDPRTCEEACDAGKALGCSDVAAYLVEGTRVPRDAKRALGIYEGLCSKGDPTSCHNVAMMLSGGHGVPSDEKRASEFFARAAKGYDAVCKLGRNDACGALGAALAKGLGVPKDIARGAKLLADACDAGNAWSCEQAKALPRR